MLRWSDTCRPYGVVSCPANNLTFAAADFGGVQGTRREHIGSGSVTDEQRRTRTKAASARRVEPEMALRRRCGSVTALWGDAPSPRLAGRPFPTQQMSSYLRDRTLGMGSIPSYKHFAATAFWECAARSRRFHYQDASRRWIPNDKWRIKTNDKEPR
jgi:hypothetical protein